MRLLAVVLVPAVLGFSPACVDAQTRPALEPGSRVRVTYARHVDQYGGLILASERAAEADDVRHERIEGLVTVVDSSTFQVADGPSTHVIPYWTIERIRVRVGDERDPSMAANVLMGMGIGGLGAGLIGAASVWSCLTDEQSDAPCGIVPAVGLVAGGVLGGLAGVGRTIEKRNAAWVEPAPATTSAD